MRIICRRDVFKLPPALEDSDEFLKNLGNITHLVFNHTDIKNNGLARNIAELSGYTETVDIQPAGVIVKIRQTSSEPTLHADETQKATEKNAPVESSQPAAQDQ